jgi:regulator of PEP synthase PpsR (kinase-PPPase family)
MGSNDKPVHVMIVSDATGITAERVISAAMLQFEHIRPICNKYAYVKTEEKIEAILTEAGRKDAIVIYSLVSKALRAYFTKRSRATTTSKWPMCPSFETSRRRNRYFR